jgi:hypothetical protein
MAFVVKQERQTSPRTELAFGKADVAFVVDDVFLLVYQETALVHWSEMVVS